jgi:hypothetical protein
MYNICNAWHSRSCPNECRLCYNSCLVTWTVVRLTAVKLKSLTFSVRLRLFRCREHLQFHDFVWLLLIACTVSLCSHKYMVLGKPCATRNRCTLWKFTNNAEIVLLITSLHWPHKKRCTFVAVQSLRSCLFAESLPSNGCCIMAYFAIIA